MIKNYFLTALRNILRYKGFSFINIFGLAISMSVCMLMITVIIDQFKYDNFVPNQDRIYRIESIDNMSKYSLRNFASTTFPLYNELTNNYDLLEDAIIIENSFSGNGLYNETKIPIRGYFTNENFIPFLNFQLTDNSFPNPLSEAFSIVIKEEIAEKYFGKENPIGKFIQIDSLGNFKITGIIEKPINKTQFQFEVLTSTKTMEILEREKKIKENQTDWERYYSSYIYIKVRDGVDINTIENTLKNISAEKYKNNEKYNLSFYLKPFNKIVPGDFIGNEIGLFLPKVFILFLGGLCLVIIISAAFNYTSLSMARSLLRAKEVGVRKTLGAKRVQIIFQFLAEAIVIALLALFFAVVMLQLILPGFSGMKLMSLIQVSPQQDLTMYLWFFIFAVLTGFISGILPATYISLFNPISVLKGSPNIKLLSKITLRKILLVSQFVFSMVFIISIIVIYRQMNHMVNADMGFDRNFVYNVRLKGNSLDKVKNYYSQFPEVTNIAGASHVPGVGNIWDAEIRKNKEDEKQTAHYFAVDENYLDVMGIKLIEGNNFQNNLTAKEESFVIIDENTVSKLNLGNANEAIGQSLYVGDSSLCQIIGVMQDYEYAAMFLPVRPLILRYRPTDYRIAALRIESGVSPAIIAKIKSEWKNIDKFNEFEGEFLDTEIRDYYSYFEDVIYTVGFASILAIVIACLGLLGMATYSTQTRIKEIGVRKVFGSTNKEIIYLIAKGYLRMFFIAGVIAGPIAYIINNAWVQYIKNHAPFGFGTIFLGIFIIILFGLITITSQTLKAANTNPANSLRYE